MNNDAISSNNIIIRHTKNNFKTPIQNTESRRRFIILYYPLVYVLLETKYY